MFKCCYYVSVWKGLLRLWICVFLSIKWCFFYVVYCLCFKKYDIFKFERWVLVDMFVFFINKIVLRKDCVLWCYLDIWFVMIIIGVGKSWNSDEYILKVLKLCVFDVCWVFCYLCVVFFWYERFLLLREYCFESRCFFVYSLVLIFIW